MYSTPHYLQSQWMYIFQYPAFFKSHYIAFLTGFEAKINIHKKKVKADSGGIRKASSEPFCYYLWSTQSVILPRSHHSHGYKSQATITFAKDKRMSMQGSNWQGDHHVCALAQGIPWRLRFFRSILNGLSNAIWKCKGIYSSQRKPWPTGEWTGICAYVWVGPYMVLSQQQNTWGLEPAHKRNKDSY